MPRNTPRRQLTKKDLAKRQTLDHPSPNDFLFACDNTPSCTPLEDANLGEFSFDPRPIARPFAGHPSGVSSIAKLAWPRPPKPSNLEKEKSFDLPPEDLLL